MSLHRRAAKRDANEAAISEALIACGCSVVKLSAPGCPDLLVWHVRKGWQLIEVKSKTGKLTPAQVDWREAWDGPAPLVMRTVDEALDWVREKAKA